MAQLKRSGRSLTSKWAVDVRPKQTLDSTRPLVEQVMPRPGQLVSRPDPKIDPHPGPARPFECPGRLEFPEGRRACHVAFHLSPRQQLYATCPGTSPVTGLPTGAPNRHNFAGKAAGTWDCPLITCLKKKKKGRTNANRADQTHTSFPNQKRKHKNTRQALSL